MKDFYSRAIEATENRMLQTDPKSDGFTLLNNLNTVLKIRQKKRPLYPEKEKSGEA